MRWTTATHPWSSIRTFARVYEELAKALGRDVSKLADAVLRQFLDESERHLTAIDAAIAEADAGQLLDYDDVKAEVTEKLSALSRR